ncbi:MAG: hypothetical protein IKM75_04615 [Bacteroidales bacterium]|nr:hypothetical protein [Bacteroidales bacterium]
MDRKELIQRYLESESTSVQEKELADSFSISPPVDEEEQAVYRMLQAITPIRTEELPEAGDEFDRIIRKARTRKIRNWGLVVSGIAAILVAVVFLVRRPDEESPEPEDTMELLQKLQFISNLDPADADGYEFKPVGDGFIMTAHFKDGREASFILTPIEGGQSFYLVSLND